jgi:hypothetical protein
LQRRKINTIMLVLVVCILLGALIALIMVVNYKVGAR